MANRYDSSLWREVADRAKARDGHRCTVARLLGGECGGVLHAHHVVPVADAPERAYDLDNVRTVCAVHHPMWEALRGILVQRILAPPPRCRHAHRSAEARRLCERRMARQRARLDRVAA